MSAPIKPGSLCIVLTSGRAKNSARGRIVEAVAYVGTVEKGEQYVTDGWMVKAPGDAGCWVISARYLRPITDPDLDVTERTDALHDNLLEFLATRYAPTEAA